MEALAQQCETDERVRCGLLEAVFKGWGEQQEGDSEATIETKTPTPSLPQPAWSKKVSSSLSSNGEMTLLAMPLTQAARPSLA